MPRVAMPLWVQPMPAPIVAASKCYAPLPKRIWSALGVSSGRKGVVGAGSASLRQADVSSLGALVLLSAISRHCTRRWREDEDYVRIGLGRVIRRWRERQRVVIERSLPMCLQQRFNSSDSRNH
jgi:hypothetical protein